MRRRTAVHLHKNEEKGFTQTPAAAFVSNHANLALASGDPAFYALL
jgi:hypothetical protein